MKKIIAFVLAFVFSASGCFAAFNLPDGGEDIAEAEAELTVIDLNGTGAITGAGAVPTGMHTANGNKFSALWEHNTRGYLDFKTIPTDWSDYFVLKFSVYGENAAGSEFALVAVCKQGYFQYTVKMQEGQNDFEIRFSEMKAQTGADWSQMSYLRLSATGWGMKVTPGAKYFINSVTLRKQSEGLERLYNGGEIKQVYDALENGVAVYADSKNALSGPKVTQYQGAQYVDEVITAPVSLFTDYLGVQTSDAAGSVTIRNGNNTVTVTPDSAEYMSKGTSGSFKTKVYTDEDMLYVPAKETAELLGFETKLEKKLLIIGDEKIRALDSYSKANNLLEIAGYLTYHTDVDPAEVTREDMKEMKDRWRYNMVADENIDLTDPDLAKIVKQVGDTGKSSWDLLKKDAAGSLFLDGKPTASSGMSSEYIHILRMAKAWAQYGSELYQNEKLRDDILFCLEWMYENRYGTDEILNNENAWRDHTLTNWYDWQIDTPKNLVDIMMLMEDYLSAEQKENYMQFFEYWVHERCYNSMFVDAGMNVLYTAINWIGSCLLRENAEEAIEAVSSLHNCFSWGDTFTTREGFYTDGSYVFHYKHPMTGQYGISQFEKSGVILSVLKDTKLDFRNPRRENVISWVFDAFEPLVYDGAMFRFVMGRAHTSNNHGVGRQFIRGTIDLLDFADSEDRARMEEIIKYTALKDKAISYNDSSFTVPQMVKLKAILNDESVQPREDYILSKVYHNMDKTVHHRKKWALGISMSSSRIYDYECIQGANSTGWYLSDGFTQLMLENDQTQFNPAYFSNIDPYKYPGTTVDTQERTPHTIDTGSAFVKDFDDVGGVSLKNEFSVSAQHLNAFHLDEEKQGNAGNIISPHNSTLTARKSWFCFDDEVVCLGSDINADDGFEVRTIVENRKANKLVSTIPENETTKSYEIIGVEASQVPQSENSPENTLDNDYGTKWAGDGLSHIIYDLGEVKPVGFVAFAFANGNKRTQKIDIELSTDGKEWTQMFAGDSGGKTEGLEIFDMKGTEARYVKLVSYGNSDGGSWISLSEAKVYAPNASGKGVVTPKYVGAEKVVIDAVEDSQIFDTEKKLNNVSWLNLENVGGYYFPGGENITVRKTNAETSFFEMWMSHGISPKSKGYSYVLLPTMTAEQTGAYAENPDIQVLMNTEKIQAVRDGSTGITGVVFWQAGSFDGIKVNQPMVMMYRRSEGKTELAVADTTHKLKEAEISFEDALTPIGELDYRMTLENGGRRLRVVFANSSGASIESDFAVSGE